MKCNVNLTVTDEQRNALACLLAGKETKRLASRDDVAGYVLGMMAGLLPRTAEGALLSTPDEPPTPQAKRIAVASKPGMTAVEARKFDTLIAEGKSAGYARGWITASRAFFGGRV